MSSRRSRSFEGCWTCRKRRVRCDGGKPGCKRCTAAGFECSGYGFRFDIPPGVQSSRQRLAAGSRPDLYLRLTSEDIVQHLHDIDASADSKEIGPFSVISFTPCGIDCHGETKDEQSQEDTALLQHRPGETQPAFALQDPRNRWRYSVSQRRSGICSSIVSLSWQISSCHLRTLDLRTIAMLGLQLLSKG